MKDIINKIYHNKISSKIFHTLVYCLQKELKDCETVLDLGCGPSSPLQYCKNIKYSVGIEVFKPYYEKTKMKQIHTETINNEITELCFNKNSFEAVILIEVLEHLPKEEGKQILKKAEKWAKKKVIVSTPNGFIHQITLDNNPRQKHLSGWDYEIMRKLGFQLNGLAGLKCLRKESEDDIMGNDLLSPIKFKPKLFWFIILSVSQIFVYFLPIVAFELFCVKQVNDRR
ncbi:MAG TPA: methyltransferase domain-containing protein [Nitrospirae bacterium]|nr:methyltransferase domain-containing protein [Nitrospirota bacterium]